jgi:hypothetical protein
VKLNRQDLIYILLSVNARNWANTALGYIPVPLNELEGGRVPSPPPCSKTESRGQWKMSSWISQGRRAERLYLQRHYSPFGSHCPSSTQQSVQHSQSTSSQSAANVALFSLTALQIPFFTVPVKLLSPKFMYAASF